MTTRNYCPETGDTFDWQHGKCTECGTASRLRGGIAGGLSYHHPIPSGVKAKFRPASEHAKRWGLCWLLIWTPLFVLGVIPGSLHLLSAPGTELYGKLALAIGATVPLQAYLAALINARYL